MQSIKKLSLETPARDTESEQVACPIILSNNELEIEKKQDEPIRISGFHNFGFGGNFSEVNKFTDVTSSVVTLDNPVDISDNTAHSGRSPESSNSPGISPSGLNGN